MPKKLPAGERITIYPTAPMYEKDVIKVLVQLARQGFDVEGYTLPESGLTGVIEQLGPHLKATRPKGPEDRVGKEHFWAAGNEFDSRGIITSLYTHLIFPVTAKGHHRLGKVIPRDELGLDVKTREEVGFPMVPKGIITGKTLPSNAQIVHQRSTGEVATSDELVVQVGGLIALSTKPKQVGRLNGIDPRRQQLFRSITKAFETQFDRPE